MVSYCGQWLSVVRRRPSCVVRRSSTFDVYTLEAAHALGGVSGVASFITTDEQLQ